MTPSTCMTPAGALARAAAAGLAGTLAMDALWYRRYRRDGGEDGFLEWNSEYPPSVLRQDLSAHLVFGMGTGVAFGTLAPPVRDG